ncbi:hypothetical protein BKA82DRAFT_792555 [Pisolithus tinctorius]|uniref:Uncharacterized protein n=1 Tax=Pisolithus tinctorius Marx 270 TaxID=870435 RepID=A0A0C3JR28_PISTI|nr:hypothetical protein BKA82DRAFT_792555 [Pisolithus tinctorius]KIO11638.1 hypothetical protein M404DRAFT_792555 [Pisolithus tinctorius Marx 270]
MIFTSASNKYACVCSRFSHPPPLRPCCRQTLIPPRRPQCNSQVLSSLSCSRAQPSQVPCLQTVIHCVWSVRPLKTGGEVAPAAEQIGNEAPQISNVTGEESPLQLACARRVLLSIFACLFRPLTARAGNIPHIRMHYLSYHRPQKRGSLLDPSKSYQIFQFPPLHLQHSYRGLMRVGGVTTGVLLVCCILFLLPLYTLLFCTQTRPQPPCERDLFTTQSGEKRKK